MPINLLSMPAAERTTWPSCHRLLNLEFPLKRGSFIYVARQVCHASQGNIRLLGEWTLCQPMLVKHPVLMVILRDPLIQGFRHAMKFYGGRMLRFRMIINLCIRCWVPNLAKTNDTDFRAAALQQAMKETKPML
ncbi:hypothetical protein O181_029475 [Austropuccinia psidii MF-1]|uniref:Uncharacterized protein n=1 Tax=Austropuccinia psidii MF-1 TaxID=1389203 RepID=A0A9Q3H585_9BASI|nr:hypothetical protein [Austropuccinia psidii MF-1]